MLTSINGIDAYAYTGDQPYNQTQPTVVFIHGAQNDHTVWMLQARHFSDHGWNVLALDLPGHGRSNGAALDTIEAMALWVLSLLDAAGVPQAMLVGHSMGSLVALEVASLAPHRVSKLALLGIAFPMKVSDQLLDTAKNDEPRAIDMVNKWSHSLEAQNPSSSGFQAMATNKQLMQHISSLNPDHVFYTDFSACNAYAHGDIAAQAVQCPTLFLLAKLDVMTPVNASASLVAAIAGAQVVELDHCGHNMMGEQPDAMRDALVLFANSLANPVANPLDRSIT